MNKRSQKNLGLLSLTTKIVQMGDGIVELFFLHLPGTVGTVLDACKADNAPPPGGGNVVV